MREYSILCFNLASLFLAWGKHPIQWNTQLANCLAKFAHQLLQRLISLHDLEVDRSQNTAGHFALHDLNLTLY